MSLDGFKVEFTFSGGNANNPSKGSKESKNSSSSELATSLDSKTGKEPEKHLTELSTARCVTASNSNGLNASRTPLKRISKQGAEGPKQAAELVTGAVVTVQHAGSDVNGIQTRVTGKAADDDGRLLYRLEHCVEGKPLMLPGDCLAISDKASDRGVIQATAAQLLQGLGKACPFIGPGVWTVKREEVSPLAWRQLRRIVGEG